MKLPVYLMVSVPLAACPVAADPPSTSYELMFEDNFDGDAVNVAHWRYRTDHRTNSYIDGLNLKKNVSVSDGRLRIALRQEKVNGEDRNTGGGLISNHQFGYGYYESLFRPFMAGKGVHTSFWQSGGNVPNNNIFEIDGCEIDSTHHRACNNLYLNLVTKHERAPWPSRDNVLIAPYPKDGWLVDSYEYTPDGVVFYDNGKPVASVHRRDLTAAQCVWLTSLNGCGPVDGTKQPAETQFDYFRFYAKDFPGANLMPNGSFEYNQDAVDPAKPVAWQPSGTKGAIHVTQGASAHDNYHLILGSDTRSYDVSVEQSLAFIRNGVYELTAMIRNPQGNAAAAIEVFNSGSEPLAVAIPEADTWTKIHLPKIVVSNQGAAVRIKAQGKAGQTVAIDGLQFRKPRLPGQKEREVAPFKITSDPIWRHYRQPVRFVDGQSFCFFDRFVGYGDRMTVSFFMTPLERLPCSPIARIPSSGRSGWAVVLTEEGGVALRIGSAEDHADVIAHDVYQAGEECHVSCVYDRGTASVYINGVLRAQREGISHDTKDETQAGKVGAVDNAGEAIGDVTVLTNTKATNKVFRGQLRDLRVHNRALTAGDINALSES